jgi:HEAT repeat protein
MIALHDRSDDAEVKERIESILRGITDPNAYDTLAEIVADRRFPLTDPLTAAAVESMAHLDTPAAASRLLQRLNEAGPDEDIERMFQVVADVKLPDARQSLESAAQGMKEVDSAVARAAAVYALRNYLDENTLVLWQTLAADENAAVQNAAERCLVWARSQAQSQRTSVPDGG